MTCNLDVGSFIFHQTYGYGEITTVNEDCTMVFIDFRNGHFDWFEVDYLQCGNCVSLAENAFIRVIFKEGDNIKDILQRYSYYRFIDILFLSSVGRSGYNDLHKSILRGDFYE